MQCFVNGEIYHFIWGNELRSLICMHGTYPKEEEDMFVCMYADWQAHGLNS